MLRCCVGHRDSYGRDSYRKVSVGWLRGCALTAAGAIRCWGMNSDGQSDAPARTFVDLTPGSLHSCAVETSGEVTCWGQNNHGQSAP